MSSIDGYRRQGLSTITYHHVDSPECLSPCQPGHVPLPRLQHQQDQSGMTHAQQQAMLKQNKVSSPCPCTGTDNCLSQDAARWLAHTISLPVLRVAAISCAFQVMALLLAVLCLGGPLGSSRCPVCPPGLLPLLAACCVVALGSHLPLTIIPVISSRILSSCLPSGRRLLCRQRAAGLNCRREW